MDSESGSVRSHLDGVAPKRRQDAEKLLELMARVTGEPPRLWGSVIGFGQYHYKYRSGREGDAPAAGFSPRGDCRRRSLEYADHQHHHQEFLTFLRQLACAYPDIVAWWRSSAGMLTALASRSAVMAWVRWRCDLGVCPLSSTVSRPTFSGVALTALTISYKGSEPSRVPLLAPEES